MRPRSDEEARARLNGLADELRLHPGRHRLRVLAVALLGYVYPLMLVLGSSAICCVLVAFAPAAFRELSMEGAFVYVAVLVGALCLVAACIRAFWIALPDEESGIPLQAGEAQPLRTLLEELSHATGNLRVHHIYIDISLNAGVQQRPRWGPPQNVLVLGLPMLLCLRADELRSVLAHELGHLYGGHNAFAAWVYRIHRTLETVDAPIARSRAGALLLGWFTRWYGEWFALTTLPLRRQQECAADAHSAVVTSSTATARALIAVDLAAYRLARDFWPALLREASHDPLPPNDIYDRIAEFLRTEPAADGLVSWQALQRTRRTQLAACHPCLGERLQALGQQSLLDDGPVLHAESATYLLGDSFPRIRAAVNALWKACVIDRWRHDHAAAEAMSKEEDEWQQAAYAAPPEAEQMLMSFLAQQPTHADANFALGKLLLERDDLRSCGYLETAMQSDSGTIGPALQLLLEYYRQVGDDAQSDRILSRVLAYQKSLEQARKERRGIRRRDRFQSHGLNQADLDKVKRVLYRYPRIEAGWLARKDVKLFSDKPGYVLGLECTWRVFDHDSRSDDLLVRNVEAGLPIACTVVMLRGRYGWLRKRLMVACPHPIRVSPS